MAATHVSTLVDRILQERLASEESLTKALAELRTDDTGQDETVAAIADHLADKGLLTKWQANALLEGSSQRLHIGNYTLVEKLGSGGLSSVYLAEHQLIQRRAAIKILLEDDTVERSLLQRFYREAQAAASLDHPNIVRLYDVASEGDTHYIVMEHVKGRDLQRLVAEDGRLEFDTCADYVAQIAFALEHAHQAGLIHRDVKPANCIASEDGLVKLLDLGLAKFAEGNFGSLTVDNDERLLGTVDYLAPEQAMDSHAVDGRADIYSLGCTLYYLLTGHPPFQEGSVAQRLMKHQKESPKTVDTYRPETPAELVQLCQDMTLKDPRQRIQTAGEVGMRLADWLQSRGKQVTGASERLTSRSAVPAQEQTSPQGDSESPTQQPPFSVSAPDSATDQCSSVEDSRFASAVADTGDWELELAPADEDTIKDQSSTTRVSRGSKADDPERPSDDELNRQIERLAKELKPIESSDDELFRGAPIATEKRLPSEQHSWWAEIQTYAVAGFVLCLVLGTVVAVIMAF